MVEKLQASRSRGAGVLCVVRPSAATPTACRASLGADPHGKNRLVCQFAQLPMNGGEFFRSRRGHSALGAGPSLPPRELRGEHTHTA